MIFSSDGFHYHSEMGVRSSAENEDGGDSKLLGTTKGPLSLKFKGVGVFSSHIQDTFVSGYIGAGEVIELD